MFMLNSAEHGFILLINVKMLIVDGILTFIRSINHCPVHLFSQDFVYGDHLGPGSKILCLEVWDEYIWTDPRLSWDKDKCDVGNLHLPLDKVWTPDVGIDIYR